MRYLHWFQNDLRLDDNPTLSSTLTADSLLCIYLLPKAAPLVQFGRPWRAARPLSAGVTASAAGTAAIPRSGFNGARGVT